MSELPTIGVIGAGFVGSAVARGFNLFADVRVYDIDPKRATHKFEETVSSDFVFICLPTPMKSAEGAECDLSIIESFFEQYSHVSYESGEIISRAESPIFIIKSTVPIGTTKKLYEQYRVPIVHNPEFLTARTALIDFITPARNIVGGTVFNCATFDKAEDENRYHHPDAVSKVQKLLLDRFPGAPCLVMSSEESEFVKYMANTFFATKVMFFNEMRMLADKLALDWDSVLEGTMADGRIGKSHYQVPGHDGDWGFGGTCVLPDAEVRIRTKEINDVDWEYENISIQRLYKVFNSEESLQTMVVQIESTNFNCTEIEWKDVEDVMERRIDEDIVILDTEQCTFKCTEDHLIPILRDEKQILIKAKDIKDGDEIFLKEMESTFLEISNEEMENVHQVSGKEN